MSDKKLRLAGAANDSIVDGPGLRLALFMQGCLHDCTGCHNPETHELEGGYLQSVDSLVRAMDKNPLLDGLTFSGGEPLLQPEPLIELAQIAHERGLDIWCYTGYLFEEILLGTPSDEATELLRNVDVLVDGPFMIDQRSLELRWKGSANQRVIDVPASLEAGEVVLKELRR